MLPQRASIVLPVRKYNLSYYSWLNVLPIVDPCQTATITDVTLIAWKIPV
jgi:hypothetical protein